MAEEEDRYRHLVPSHLVDSYYRREDLVTEGLMIKESGKGCRKCPIREPCICASICSCCYPCGSYTSHLKMLRRR